MGEEPEEFPPVYNSLRKEILENLEKSKPEEAFQSINLRSSPSVYSLKSAYSVPGPRKIERRCPCRKLVDLSLANISSFFSFLRGIFPLSFFSLADLGSSTRVMILPSFH